MTPRKVIPRHPRPPCGHAYLRDCPLTPGDYETVFFAWLGFLATCRHVSEAAHLRAEGSGRG